MILNAANLYGDAKRAFPTTTAIVEKTTMYDTEQLDYEALLAHLEALEEEGLLEVIDMGEPASV